MVKPTRQVIANKYEEDNSFKSVAKTKVVGRMPERSEAISGNESKGRTPVAAAQETNQKFSKLRKIAKAKAVSNTEKGKR